MPDTIILDAGHGGQEPGALFQGRREADDNLRLALAVGRLLQEDGFPVLYTRTEDVYQSPYEKAVIANNSGADVLISFHRNSTPEPETYSGVQTLVYQNQGLPAELAGNINRALEEVGFADNGISERPDLVVLRRTQMPAVLIETGYLNTAADNQLFDERFDEIARAIADGIEETLGSGDMGAMEVRYQVQTGAYAVRERAERLQRRMRAEGIPARIVEEDGLYKVRAGDFRYMENAVRLEQVLRSRGYPTFIVSR